MQYRDMSEVDFKLVLLGGDSVEVGNITIEPYKLGEVKSYGYSKYTQNLQLMTLTVDDFIDSVDDEEKKKYLKENKDSLRTLDFYLNIGGDELGESLLDSLAMIFKTDDIRVLQEGVIALDFIKEGILVEDENGELVPNEERLEALESEELKIIDRDIFDDIVRVVKILNYIENPSLAEEEDLNPADEETRLLQEHMKQMREKVAQAKNQQSERDDSETVDIADIVSAVSSKSNSINKLNIWDFTLYQVYDEYARLELIDNYDFSIQAIMAGAEKVDLKHWSSKL